MPISPQRQRLSLIKHKVSEAWLGRLHSGEIAGMDPKSASAQFVSFDRQLYLLPGAQLL